MKGTGGSTIGQGIGNTDLKTFGEEPRLNRDVPKHSLILQHPTGNQVSRHVAVALNRAGYLKEFWTSISWNPTSIANKFLPSSLSSELKRRSYPTLPGTSVRTKMWPEVGRLFLQRLRKLHRVSRIKDYFSVDNTYRSLDRTVAERILSGEYFTGVYAFEDGALESFLSAKRSKAVCFYDLPIGYWRAYREIMTEEAERQPELASTLGGKDDPIWKLEQKDRELELADLIIVASTFTQRTLALYPGGLGEKVISIPYGAPPPSPPRPPTTKSKPLKVLYVGSLGQRKGISYLLDAINALGKSCELTLLGRPVASNPSLERELGIHKWIPSAPHSQVLQIMRDHDVLVFPSLFEGFGMVILEGMSQGMAVITTANTIGPDVITDGIDGFLVPLRSSTAISETIVRLHDDRNMLASISLAAQRRAEDFTWKRYEEELVRIVTSTPPDS